MAIELSPEFIEAAQALRHSPELAHQLGEKILVDIVGPSAIGKSTLIDTAHQLDPAFGRVVGFTTRPRRPHEPDGTYRFLPHSQATIDDIETKLGSGSLVQLAIHPTTGYLYGSEPSDYPAKYNLIDMLYSEVETMRRLPFQYCLTIGVSAQADHWEAWFMDRYQQQKNPEDARQRLDEAYQSISWSLHDIDTMWVQNIFNDPTTSAEKIIRMSRGDEGSNGQARYTAIYTQNVAIPRLRQLVMEAAA